MQEEALQQFLSSVRCDRFIDYLDPIGETAEEALARRVRWARMTRNDPAHADEAMFLLQHERALRSVLSRELDEEGGWVEAVSAGQGQTPARWSRGAGETTDMDTLAPPRAVDDDSSDEQRSPELDALPTGIMRIEDFTLDDPPTLTPSPTLPPAVNHGTKPSAATLERPTIAAAPGLLQSRGRVRTASPATRRTVAPTLGSVLDTPSLPPTDTLGPQRGVTLRADGEATDPSARPSPELARAIAEAARPGPLLDPALAATDPRPPARAASAPTRTPQDKDDRVPLPLMFLGGVVALFLVGATAVWWTTPSSDPLIEAPPAARAVGEPIQPASTPSPAAPSPATPAGTDAQEPAADEAPPPPDAPPPPEVDTPTPAPAPTTTAAIAPTPQPRASGRERQPAPVAAVPAAAPQAEPIAASAEPKPAAQPSSAAVATKPAAEPKPKAAPAPVPATDAATEAPPPNLRGMWGGAAGTLGVMVRIQTQTEDRFTGTAELLDAAGSSSVRQAVTGRVEGDTIRFSAPSGALSFHGRFDGSQIVGTIEREGVSLACTLAR